MNSIFAALPSAIVILKSDDPDFTVEEVNKRFLNLTGMDRPVLINRPFFKTINEFAANGYDQTLKELHSLAQEVTSEKEIIETDIFEFILVEAGSSKKKDLYLQFKYSPVLKNDGTIDSIILVVEDVTDLLTTRERSNLRVRKLSTRQELHSLNEHLAAQAATNKTQYESASQELDAFVYSVSHDLRAPLRRIDGFSQELLNEYVDRLDETGVHYLNRIRQGAQDMGNLIDDLLKLSRISRKNIECEEIDLGEISRSIFDELKELEPEREVTLQVGAEVVLEADKGLIRAMMTNLISNALKFTSGRDVAEITIDQEIKDGENIFFISDNGIGFDSAYSDKLFKAFSRLHSSKEFKGTGIGLATVKRIINLHGGDIWAESEKGEGATFYFKL